MIFQDPMSSLNPRHTIGRILIEPILLIRRQLFPDCPRTKLMIPEKSEVP